jgi:gliding motility-associated-like protein
MLKHIILYFFLFFNSILFYNSVFSANYNKNLAAKYFKEELIFADFFSPNGDGHNDTFVIKNIEEHPINKIHIFNRWGEIVYQSEPYRNDWDGTMNIQNQWFGNVLPEGMYFYRFEFIVGDFITQRNGKIILKR